MSRWRSTGPMRGGSTLAVVLALAGCAVAPTTPSVLVLPGNHTSAAQFQVDDAVCRQRAHDLVAPQASAANNQAAGAAVVGTALGAAIGALMGSGSYYQNSSIAWGAGSGLMMGSAVGSGNSQSANYGLQQRFDVAFMQCMYQRGNQVPGHPTARRNAPSATTPNYPPPDYPAPANLPPNTAPSNYPPPNTLPPRG